MTYAALRDSRLRAIVYRRMGTGQMSTFNGRDVIVDDREPRNEVIEALVTNLFAARA